HRRDLIAQHLESIAPRPSELVHGVPPALDEMLMRLLEKEPRRRLGYAVDVIAALAALGAGSDKAPTAARPRSYLYRPGFGGRRRELYGLMRLLPASRLDPTSLVAIGGEGGIGKTRLVVDGHQAG